MMRRRRECRERETEPFKYLNVLIIYNIIYYKLYARACAGDVYEPTEIYIIRARLNSSARHIYILFIIFDRL